MRKKVQQCRTEILKHHALSVENQKADKRKRAGNVPNPVAISSKKGRARPAKKFHVKRAALWFTNQNASYSRAKIIIVALGVVLLVNEMGNGGPVNDATLSFMLLVRISKRGLVYIAQKSAGMQTTTRNANAPIAGKVSVENEATWPDFVAQNAAEQEAPPGTAANKASIRY